jgi:hypothetical protein
MHSQLVFQQAVEYLPNFELGSRGGLLPLDTHTSFRHILTCSGSVGRGGSPPPPPFSLALRYALPRRPGPGPSKSEWLHPRAAGCLWQSQKS